MGTIHHFSHSQHALTATHSLSYCSFCRRSKCTSRGGYACHACQYFLGSLCARLEQQVTVPAHKHPLDLVSTTENGAWSCDACGGRILGLRYNCSCNYDLHAECALWPAKITSRHHEHPLSLVFPAGPQLLGGNGITCMKCGNKDLGLQSWVLPAPRLRCRQIINQSSPRRYGSYRTSAGCDRNCD